MAVLIDSSIYIDWLRRRVNIVSATRAFLANSELLSCGIIRMEVLRGIPHPGQRARMQEFFSITQDVVMDAGFWDGAWMLAWTLDRKGIVLPLTDLCIAHAAMVHDAELVSADPHFRRIPGLKLRTACAL